MIPGSSKGCLLAIDPGNVTGWAMFYDGELRHFGKLPGELAEQDPIGPGVKIAVIEEPKIRRRHPRPEDIIQLAVRIGKISANYPRSVHVKPEQWKGQLPKAVCWHRAMKRLTPIELRYVMGSKLDHNVKDAIALGLWALGRF